VATFILLNLLAIGAYARFTPDHCSAGPAGTGAVPAVERDTSCAPSPVCSTIPVAQAAL
jgi:hypothetical protein